MTPSQRREKVRAEQAEQIAQAKARTEAANERLAKAKRNKMKKDLFFRSFLVVVARQNK